MVCLRVNVLCPETKGFMEQFHVRSFSTDKVIAEGYLKASEKNVP